MKTQTFELKFENGTLIIPTNIQNYFNNSQEKIKVSLTIESSSQETNNLKEEWEKWFEEVDKLKPTDAQIEIDDYQQLLIDKYRKEGLDL